MPRQLFDSPEHLTQTAQGCLVVFEEQTVRLGRQGGQPARVRLSRLLGPEPFLLVDAEVGFLDLVRLESEHLAPPFRFPAVPAQALERALHFAKTHVRGPYGGAVETPVMVQKVDVRGGVEQALGIVLAVDGGEERRQLLEQGQRHEPPVHRGPALSGGLDLPPHDHLFTVRREAMLLQEGLELRPLREGFHEGPLLAGADEIGGSPLAQDEPECVYQDGLARSGLAGEQGQPGAQLDLERGDERNVVDSK